MSLLISSVLALMLMVNQTHAQTFTVLKNFDEPTNITGFFPHAQLVQGPDGTLYGTTSSGKDNVQGTVFKMQPDGSGYAVLKWFTNSFDGANPVAGLTLSGGTLYGTTSSLSDLTMRIFCRFLNK
ncbi:MAG: choice-of-anchor tandem repeat GloVer-containing protein, partial [Verrucomicrobiota bacterium]